LLSAIDPATGQSLDDTQIKAEVSTFMAAGFETTSHAITWTLTMLVSSRDRLQLSWCWQQLQCL
jgi:cytochrome P450